jgi:hypothetical protein
MYCSYYEKQAYKYKIRQIKINGNNCITEVTGSHEKYTQLKKKNAGMAKIV